MAVLIESQTGRMATLGARTIVGRSRVCNLRLDKRKASGEHAALTWDGDQWKVRDLGSRNGTWLGDTRLAPGQEAAVPEGTVLAFGDLDARWLLADARPPTPFARANDQGDPVEADGGLLALPSSEQPDVMIFRAPTGWLAEDATGQRPVADQEVVAAGDTLWRLFLPVVLERTLVDTDDGGISTATMKLRLTVSRDQEFVEVDAWLGDGWTRLKPRTHHYMLVVLADAWARDADAPPDDRGWVHLIDVAKALQVESRSVNTYICRVRQHFGRVGVRDAARTIERRPGTSQIRLGVRAEIVQR